MNNTSVLNASDDNDIDEVFCSFSDAFKFPVLACYLIIVAVAMVGNFVVCCTIMVDRNLREQSNNNLSFLVSMLGSSDCHSRRAVRLRDVFFYESGRMEKSCAKFGAQFLPQLYPSRF